MGFLTKLGLLLIVVGVISGYLGNYNLFLDSLNYGGFLFPAMILLGVLITFIGIRRDTREAYRHAGRPY